MLLEKMTSALCSGSEHEDSWSTDSPLLSQNTEDREFIISDSETLSDHGDEPEEESEDYIPVSDKVAQAPETLPILLLVIDEFLRLD